MYLKMAELCLCCCQAASAGGGDGCDCNCCGDLLTVFACYQCAQGCDSCDCRCQNNPNKDYSRVEQKEPKVLRMSRDVELVF